MTFTVLTLLVLRFSGAEIPTPGVNTATGQLPGLRISEEKMSASRVFGSIKVVVWFEPFSLTTDVLSKLFPLTTKVNEEPPVSTQAGLMEDSVVTGYETAKELLIPDCVLPVFFAVIVKVPWFEIVTE